MISNKINVPPFLLLTELIRTYQSMERNLTLARHLASRYKKLSNATLDRVSLLLKARQNAFGFQLRNYYPSVIANTLLVYLFTIITLMSTS